jgi:arylsulfatase A-like enzyme
MKKTCSWLPMIGWLLMAAFSFSCQKAEDSKPPNIVIFLSDDQGWGDLSASGNTNLETPNIDRLAAEGASLEHFYVSPVCSPTRAELLTGRYHPRSGVHGTSSGEERMDLDETTLADVFKAAGYRTAAFGKWHNGMQYPYHPNARGFEEFYGFCSGHWGNYFSPMLEHNGKIVQGEGFMIDDFTTHAIRFMEENQEQPFLVYLPYNTPHTPLQVPDRWWNAVKDRPITMKHKDPALEDEKFTRAVLALCENIDWNVGRVLDALDSLQMADNTIVLYFVDNGPNGWRWNGGMKGRKGSTDEGGVRSPLFIRWPAQIQAGKTIPQISAAIDLLPTLAGLAGIPVETRNPLDGMNLQPLLLHENAEWPERNIFSYWNGRTSVRSQQYRLDHEGKLFDMVQDPGQTEDLTDQRPAVAEALKAAATNWQDDVLADFPPHEERRFLVAHPDFPYTQLPARDAEGFGNIQRSNRWPNSSFFSNWTSSSDSISWPVEVLSEGDYQVEVYYACPPEDVGSVVELTFKDFRTSATLDQPHESEFLNLEYDRVERMESYVKDFRPFSLGTIHLEPGKGWLTLKASEIPGNQVMDFRLLMLTRKEKS